MRIPGLDPRFVAQFAPRVTAPRSVPGVSLTDEDLDALAGDVFAATMREPTGRAPDAVTVQRIGPPDVTPAARGDADIPGARFDRPGAPPMAFDNVPESAPDDPSVVEAEAAASGMVFDDAAPAPGLAAIPSAPPAVPAVTPPATAPAMGAEGGTIPAPTPPIAAAAAPAAPTTPTGAPTGPTAAPGASGDLLGLWDPANAPPGLAGRAPLAVEPTPGPGQTKAASSYRGPQFLTAGEKGDLAAAEQRDRRMRIAQGVVGGLGGLVGLIGAARGTGAAEFGTGLMSAAGAIPAGAATARVNERIGERRAFEAASLAREDEASRAAATRAREGEELALRRRAVEAQATRDEAAAAEQRAQMEREAREELARQGSVEDMRRFVRARIEGIPTSNPSRGPLMANIDAIDGLDAEALVHVLTNIRAIDVRRGESGAAGGASGAGRAESLTFDAAGNPIVVRGGGGGGGGGARPMARGGVSAPSAPAASPPAPGVDESVREQAMTLGVDGYLDDMAWVLQRQGHQPGSEEYRRGMRQFTNRLLDPDVAVRRQAIADVNAQIAQVRRSAPGGGIALPPELEPVAREFASPRGPAMFDRASTAADSLADRLEAMRARDPEAFRAAVLASQNPDVPLPPVALRMRAEIGRILSDRLHELSGAAVSVSEFARIANSMGVGGQFAWTGTDDQLIRTLRAGARAAERQFDEAARQYDQRIVDQYVDRATGGR